MNYSGFGKLKVVENKNRKFGSSQKYYTVRVYNEENLAVDLLFSPNEVERAKTRALLNEEDVLKPKSLWQKFWDYMGK